MPASKSTRSKVKQTRLQLTPLPSSPPVKEKYSSTVQNRLASVRYDTKKPQHTQLPISFGQNPRNGLLPTPEHSSQPYHDSSQHRDDELNLASADIANRSESEASALSILSYGSTVQPTVLESSGEDEIALPSSKRRRIMRHGSAAAINNETPKRRSTRRSKRLSINSSSAKAGSSTLDTSPTRRLSDLASAEVTGDEDDVMITKPSLRRRQNKQRNDGFVVDDNDSIKYTSSTEEPARRQPRSTRRAQKDDWLVDDNVIDYISSDQEPVTPSRRSGKKMKQKSDERNRREQAELEDDLADLQDSDTPKKTSRTRGGPVTTQRDKRREHIESLKRRRAGEKIPRTASFSDDEQSSDPEGVDIDTINDVRPPTYTISDDTGSVRSSVDTETEPEQAIPNNEEDDFVVSDEEDDRPAHRRLPNPEIPLEFTSYASAKPKDLFIHILEWLVKNKIAPAFARNDPIYRIAFDKINDQVSAQAGSRLISSAWNAEFKHAVLARPNMKVIALPGLDEDNIRTCDACNKTNHPARYDFVFEGKAYSKHDLEPIDDDGNDDNPNDNEEELETVSHDEKGHPLAHQSTHFYLGRYCAANAEMGHKLTHWLYHLNAELLSYLEEQGILSAEAIVNREKQNKKRREKEAENIVDQMEEVGKVSEMWRDFQSDLDDARIGMEGFEKRGPRGKNRVGSVLMQRTVVLGEEDDSD